MKTLLALPLFGFLELVKFKAAETSSNGQQQQFKTGWDWCAAQPKKVIGETGHCYVEDSRSAVTFDGADAACRSLGGALATLQTYQDASAFANAFSGDVYINLVQEAGASGVAQGWFWHHYDGTRTALDFTNWLPNEPNDASSEKIENGEENLVVFQNYGSYYDVSGNGENRPLCIFPPGGFQLRSEGGLTFDGCSSRPGTDITLSTTGWCYWIEQAAPLSWTDARAACKVKGGRLATMETREIRNFVTADWAVKILPSASMLVGYVAVNSSTIIQVGQEEGVDEIYAGQRAHNTREGCLAISKGDANGDRTSWTGQNCNVTKFAYICKQDTHRRRYQHMAGKSIRPERIRAVLNGIASSYACGLECARSELDCGGFEYNGQTKACKLAKPMLSERAQLAEKTAATSDGHETFTTKL